MRAVPAASLPATLPSRAPGPTSGLSVTCGRRPNGSQPGGLPRHPKPAAGVDARERKGGVAPRLARGPVMADDTGSAGAPDLGEDEMQAEPAVAIYIEETPLEPTQALDRFLAGVERRAFVKGRSTTGNADDAHDIVREPMWRLER